MLSFNDWKTEAMKSFTDWKTEAMMSFNDCKTVIRKRQWMAWMSQRRNSRKKAEAQ